jgi:5-methylcytosine-specific restriction protein B
MLHPELARVIKDTHRQMLNAGKLFDAETLNNYYATFRERFGPQVLQKLDGEMLLTTMHDLRRENRNSLVYWLEFKNDEEFPAVFGSISGGSALKFGVYPNAATGKWMTRDQSNLPVEISPEQAIEIARRHRDQLLRGAALLEALPMSASDEDYARLQHAIDDQLPTVGITAWGHKYFSLLFPDKLDDYHMAIYQRFHLVKLLQPDIPEERAGRYIAAGRFVRVAQELAMPMNHLTTVLNELHGKPHRYWSILASDTDSSADLDLDHQIEGGFAALSWTELGDLSHLIGKNDSKVLLRQMMEAAYPTAKARDRNGIHRFVTEIAVNDRVVLYEPRSRKAVAIGSVIGGYYFEASLARPHRLPIEWSSTDEWQFAKDEGFDRATKEIRLFSNQVAVECHLLAIGSMEKSAPTSPLPAPQVSQDAPIRLTGISGRIQTILERKGQVILYGPPGTGKTYWAETTACELSSRQVFGKPYSKLNQIQQHRIFGLSTSYVQLCSFHPAYGYEDFLEGYRPQVINDQMTFVRQNGIFKHLCELARKDAAHNYILIIDEINRGDIPRIFGELLTVLEKDKRGKSILLPVSGAAFSVPPNVFLIGTMNTADRSIALLDTALRRRFGFIEMPPDPTMLRSAIIEGIPLGAWLEELNQRIRQVVGRDGRNLQIGHAYFLDNGKPITDLARFTRVLREEIIPLLEEYCYEDYAALGKILGIALVDESNQVIRQALFEPGNEANLVQALLEPTPDLATLSPMMNADGDSAHRAASGNANVEDEL